jgi:hypothetical protein
MHIISTRVHGMLDYLVGAILIISPWALGFTTNGPAQWVPVILGAAIIIYSVLTRYELGAGPIPLGVHLALDVLAGIFLAMSPWLFGFAGVVYWPHLVLGIVAIVVATLTPSYPEHLATPNLT